MIWAQLIFLTFKWRCTHYQREGPHCALLLAGAVADGSELERYVARYCKHQWPGQPIRDPRVTVMANQRTDSWPSALILIISCRDDGTKKEIQWKVPIKDAKHCTIRCLYLPFLCWCTRTPDIHYFFSTPFLNLYLKCIYEGWVIDKKKSKMINFWKKWK